MALNIAPRRPNATATTTAVADAPASDDSNKTDETVASKSSTRTRRTTRSRSAPARTATRARTTDKDSEESEAPAANDSTSSRRSAARKDEDPTAEAEKTSTSRRSSRSRTGDDKTDDAKPTRPQGDELDRQRRTIDRLTRDVDDLKKRHRELLEKLERGDGAKSGAALQRVGIFVDVANVELATDKLSRRLDWTKVLNKLTKDRQLVRAVAYSPVHEDINVSLESQRFTEPFVDRGYRLVTKPLKKFSDGTVKANVDIEMTVEILEMLDRLDIVCLVSGDGDFEPLVRTIQSKGVRVEIVSIGAATAMALKRAGDKFTDLAAILNEVS